MSSVFFEGDNDGLDGHCLELVLMMADLQIEQMFDIADEPLLDELDDVEENSQ